MQVQTFGDSTAIHLAPGAKQFFKEAFFGLVEDDWYKAMAREKNGSLQDDIVPKICREIGLLLLPNGARKKAIYRKEKDKKEKTTNPMLQAVPPPVADNEFTPGPLLYQRSANRVKKLLEIIRTNTPR